MNDNIHVEVHDKKVIRSITRFIKKYGIAKTRKICLDNNAWDIHEGYCIEDLFVQVRNKNWVVIISGSMTRPLSEILDFMSLTWEGEKNVQSR